MQRKNLFIAFIFGTAGWMTSCGSPSSKSEHIEVRSDTESVANDSIEIIQAFENLKKDKLFLKDLGLETEKQFTWKNLHKIFRGDLDEDGVADALLAFSIEGRNGGNNFDVHYVAFLHKENQWKYAGQLDASIFAEDRFYDLQKIENGVLKGNWQGIKDESVTPYEAEFILKDGQFLNIFTALHKTENREREYLYVTEIINSKYISLQTTATTNEYEKRLGKGKIVKPTENPECGTYYEEGVYRLLEYPGLQFELNNRNDAALISLKFKNGYKVQTDKGTIDKNTKLETLKNIFYQQDSWTVFDGENGEKIFAVPDGEESDNQWHFSFDKNGKVTELRLFISC